MPTAPPPAARSRRARAASSPTTSAPPSAAAAPTRWERQPDESSKAFAYFVAYRDLGPSRSLTRARAALADAGVTVSLRNLAGLSAAHGWVDRAAAYDDERDAETRAARAAATREAATEAFDPSTVRLAVEMQTATLRLVELANARLAMLNPSDLSADEALALLDVAASLAGPLLTDEALAGLSPETVDRLTGALADLAVTLDGLPVADPDAEADAGDAETR